MSDEAAKALKSLVTTWEKKLKQAEKMLTHLRAAQAMLEAEAPAPSQAVGKKRPKASLPFSTKYGQSAGDYLRGILTRSMTLREIQDSLAAIGKTYSDQAIVFALERMSKRGEIEPRRPAPPGSAAKYVYGPVKAHQQGESVLQHRRRAG
jgi:hypothetical protein